MAKTTKKTAGKATATVEPAPRKTPAKSKARAATTDTVARKKPAKKPAAIQDTVGAKKATGTPTAKTKTPATRVEPRQITVDERHRMIAEAAYVRSEALGFLTDNHEDWLLAEAEIDARLQQQGISIRD